MRQLNYQHLLYFWTVAREGTIAKACKSLFLTQPTISAQLRCLEKATGAKLFERDGRHLVLTETGRMVYQYADEIFSLGKELQNTLEGRPQLHSQRLIVGVADVLSGTIVCMLLEPVLRLPTPMQLVCHNDKTEKLLAKLAIGELDVVLSDVPISSFVKVRAINHVLAESGVSIMGSKDLTASYQKDFPKSLNGAPFLLPFEGSSLRRSLDEWFQQNSIQPTVRGEFEDCDLIEAFGSAGMGLFAVPTIIEDTIQRQSDSELLGRLKSIKERFFAISVDKKLKHPAVVAITDSARQQPE